MINNKKPIALITGVTGQDGAHLADLLLNKGYVVYGGFRRGSSDKGWRLNYLGIKDRIKLVEFQLNDLQNILQTIQKIQPNEIYNLAGESMVTDSFAYPSLALNANMYGTLNILDSVKLVSPKSKIFFASSSEIFGSSGLGKLLDEGSLRQPENPYAISKQAADNLIKIYREKYGIFACSGILFNHEGPLRSIQFVTRKITNGMTQLKLNHNEPPIEIGNFDSARDWGSAIDYVDAMRLILKVDEPQDYVIATGKLSSVRDCIHISAITAGFDPVFEGDGINEFCFDRTTGRKISIIAERYMRSNETPPLTGNAHKIELVVGWKPTKHFEKIIEEMTLSDINILKRSS